MSDFLTPEKSRKRKGDELDFMVEGEAGDSPEVESENGDDPPEHDSEDDAPGPHHASSNALEPVQALQNVVVFTGGLLKKRESWRGATCVVARTTIVVGGLELGRRTMWKVMMASDEACRLLTGSPSCNRPLQWKKDPFFVKYREAIDKARADIKEKVRVRGGGAQEGKRIKRAPLIKISMEYGAGKIHEMIVANSTQFISVEAIPKNVDFMAQQLSEKGQAA